VALTANSLLIRRDSHECAIEDSAAPIHDRDGRVTGAVIVFHDVSTARALAGELSHLAQHDPLTDLPNRLLLNDRLAQAILLGRRNQKQVAVLFVDLDGFKHINDSLGHAVGDKLLQSVAARLAGCVRQSDTVSRQGGDEFVVLLSEVGHAKDPAISAAKIIAEVARAHGIDENRLHVTASIENPA
jgi:diguanylate cyclase (GGDEF)-like protein